ncbi:MAG: S8 family peptidase [Burkholderiales bacterium]
MRAMRFRIALILSFVLSAAGGSVHALTMTGGDTADSARVIVKFRADAPSLRPGVLSASGRSITRALALAQRQGVDVVVGDAVSDRMQVVQASGISSQDLAQRLAADGDVEYAVPDQRRSRLSVNDPLYATGGANGPAAGQWYLRAPTSDVRAAIDAEGAWTVTQGSPAIVVAVLDTGVRFEHPDLLAVAAGGNLLPGYDMISDVAAANDGDGRDADASDPGDWLTQAEITAKSGPFYQCAAGAEDSSWHGTQTAGLIGALTDNGIGMASVGRTVRVLPVRVLGKCGGYDSDIIAGMRWAAGLSVPGAPQNANRAQVINMSLGGEGTCDATYIDAVNEITAAGTVIVASAGNSSGHAVGVPANCPGVIGVGGLRHFGTKVGFSDLGPEVAISAPGGNCVNTAAGSACVYPILTTANTGSTVPLASTYTDSFNPSIGTSFSAPLVAGTAALMLSARPSLTPAQVRQILQATASPFPATGSFNSDGTAVVACTAPRYSASGTPIDQLECYCTTSTCGAGMLNAYAAVQAAAIGLPGGEVQAQGLWWNAPANSESGWGLNVAQQGDVVFATWFTYDASGRAWWLSMTGTHTGTNTYTGTLYQTRGPAYSAATFNPALVTKSAVGDATLTFTGNDTGTFRYTVNGVMQTKAITREVYGALPTCVFGVHPRLADATNYQDLWWAPNGAESGWGLNITQQSDVIFATWFTYDTDGAPLWFSGTATATGTPGAYSGPLYRSSGPAFSAQPFDATAVKLTAVGSYYLAFTDGNTGTFSYTVNGVTQSKPITRQVFRTPGTVCK